MLEVKNRSTASRRAAKANSQSHLLLLSAVLGLLVLPACSSRHKTSFQADQFDGRRVAWCAIEDLPGKVALFDTVFWDPRDTISLRKLLRQSDVVKDKRVLEIGTGSGLLSLCALQ